MVVRTLKLGAGVLLALGSTGMIYQHLETRSDAVKYPPLGKLIDIGSHKLHILSSGEKRDPESPTVILEAGFACSALDWILVQPEIATFAHVCSYDRAGYGWSQESSSPRTAENMVTELHSLLHNAQIKPPYILVGHSLGGCIIQLYATRYPDEVSGLILVDSAHENQQNELPEEVISFHSKLRKTLWISKSLLAPLGLFRLLGDHILGSMKVSHYPEAISNMRAALMCQTKCLRALYEESSHLAESFAQIEQTPRFFGTLPLTVLIAGNFNDMEQSGFTQDAIKCLKALRTKYQEDFVRRSKNGKLIIAQKSSHLIPVDQPEIIVEAVRDMLNEVTSTAK